MFHHPDRTNVIFPVVVQCTLIQVFGSKHPQKYVPHLYQSPEARATSAHGKCEQFHSEIKTDMCVERLPSGKFDTNELVLELTMIAYNVLRMLGQETVNQGKAPAKRIVSCKRIRTVIQNIIHFAGQLTKHARQLFLYYQQKQCLG